jgi:hypothetical protein
MWTILGIHQYNMIWAKIECVTHKNYYFQGFKFFSFLQKQFEKLCFPMYNMFI